MPRPRTGAPIRYIPLNTPGFMGLNKQAEGALLGPQWATRMENTVIDDQNRVAARPGSQVISNTENGNNPLFMHEQPSASAIYYVDDAVPNKIWRSIDGGQSWIDSTGTAVTDNFGGTFGDFNNRVVYAPYLQKLCVETAGIFATVADANAPTGGIILCAFGRIWGVTEAAQPVIRYSALLDPNDWSGTDSGIVDLTSVWQEDDRITGLANFNGNLVVFGQRNIVIFSDGQGSPLGINPLFMYVVDTMNGIGCIATHSIRQIDGDIWFLSNSGLVSLSRLIQQRNNPLNNISRHVQDLLNTYVLSNDKVDNGFISGVYSPRERLYLLSIPTSSEDTVAFAFDTRTAMQDGAFRCMGLWTRAPRCGVSLVDDNELILGYRAIQAQPPSICRYSGAGNYYLDQGYEYVMHYESGWSDMGDPLLKLLKRITGIFYTNKTITVSFRWAFDFANQFLSQAKTIPGSEDSAQWNISEFSVAQYGTGVVLSEHSIPARHAGEHVKVGISATINDAFLSIQQMALYAKKGRLR